MDTLPIILFPHSNVPEEDLKRIFPLFGPITICQPWFMAPPACLSEPALTDTLIIKNPPDRLKLRDDFRTILAEARNWISQYPDKSHIRSLKASHVLDSEEDATWDIRRIIREMGASASVPEEDDATRWHMILHLANEIEDQRRLLNRILMDVKKIRSPLEDSIEESEDSKGLFEDLPGPESEDIAGTFHLEPVISAWVGLYSECLHNHNVLFTVNPLIMDYVNEEWESGGDAQRAPERGMVSFKVPDLSHCTWDELVEIKDVIRKNPDFNAFHELIARYDPRFESTSRDFPAKIKSVEEVLPGERSKGEIKMTLASWPEYHETDGRKGASPLTHLSGKIIILMEEAFSCE
ncbi:MAG: hypothetical protein JRJ85_14490 [Deltaproteobacteria bacterium]|nr:hypothetical protein [Deltaproteobacteria bacterium]